MMRSAAVLTLPSSSMGSELLDCWLKLPARSFNCQSEGVHAHTNLSTGPAGGRAGGHPCPSQATAACSIAVACDLRSAAGSGADGEHPYHVRVLPGCSR